MAETGSPRTPPPSRGGRSHSVLGRVDVLSGLMFMAIAMLGLFLSRDYDIGTARQMGTGYVPRLVCLALLGLGALVFIGGLRQRGPDPEQVSGEKVPWRALVLVPACVFAFGLTVERLGLVVAAVLVVGIGSLAAPGQKPLGVLLAMVALAAASVGIFIYGLGLPFAIWPEY